MRVKLGILALILGLGSCNLTNTEIDDEKVNISDSTNFYTFKDDNAKVTGMVILYELDPLTAKKFKRAIREVKEGKRVKKGFDYFSNGSVNAEYNYDTNGLISGSVKVFYPNGKVASSTEYKANKENGLAKEFREDGTQIKETLFESGLKLKKYDFDDNGEKIIPGIEKLDLVEYKTGFYESVNYNRNEVFYLPMVIMKLKNTSDQALNERIEIEAIFINNSKGEEWSKSSNYFQGYSDAPLQPGISRQCALESDVGYFNLGGIYGANISCQILINKQLYKKVKIKNNLLTANRIK